MSPSFILIVEDDAQVADIVRTTLQMQWSPNEVDYYIVSTLRDAMEVIQNFHVDLIILDLTLPDSSHEETLTKIIELCRGHIHTVVIVLSGGITMVDGYKAMVLGADDFIMKGAPGFYENTIKHLNDVVAAAWTRHLGFMKRLALEEVNTYVALTAC